jgi:hypothetical protein
LKGKLLLVLTLLVLILVLILGLSSISYAAKLNNEKAKKPDVWPQPITNPSEAVSFSHPDKNRVNPESPLYSPGALQGPPRWHVGLNTLEHEGELSIPTPEGGEFEEGHRGYGTIISRTTGVTYTYGHLNYFSSLSIPSGDYLYAPTMLGTNDSPLEILSRYYWDSGNMKREIAVYNHNKTLPSERWVVSIGEVDDYLYNGFYAAEILPYQGSWYAMVYNYDTDEWETWHTYVGGQGPNEGGEGWCIWEEWGFDESNWPDLDDEVFEAKELIINYSGDTYVTSSHGYECDEVGSAPYDFDMVNNYYRWQVDTQ